MNNIFESDLLFYPGAFQNYYINKYNNKSFTFIHITRTHIHLYVRILYIFKIYMSCKEYP